MGSVYESATWLNLDPRLQYAFLQLQAAAPGQVSLSSGWRSHDHQAQLYKQKGPKLAARPGHSNHEFGLAIDLSFENAATRRWVHANAQRFGLWFPMDYEPWHAQLIGIDRHNASGGRQLGGGREAFADMPDGRFQNPYDALAGMMGQEDPYDPMTQFGRLVQFITAPTEEGGALASPEGPGSPAAPEDQFEAEDAAGTIVSETQQTGPGLDPLAAMGGTR
jgi:hypothetical protein